MAKHSFHHILVCEFLKVKIWHHISHTNVPNGTLPNNITYGKKQMESGKFWGFVSSYSTDKAADKQMHYQYALSTHLFLVFPQTYVTTHNNFNIITQFNTSLPQLRSYDPLFAQFLALFSPC
jgi:hypothetical protein